MKKSMISLAAIGLSMAVLTGCGGGSAASTTAAPATEAAKEEAAGGEEAGAAEEAPASDWVWERDIELVCPFDVGSGTDTTLRAICPLVEKKIGVNIVINNMGGGSGLNGAEYFYQQPADGYSYLMCTPSHPIKGVTGEASFDIQNELVAVCCLVWDTNYVFSNPKLPYTDWEGLVEYAKANPGVPTLTLQSVTGIDALCAQQLFDQAGIDVTLVAADGAEAYSMVIGGHADMTLGSYADAKQYVDAGQVIPLIVVNTERSSSLPDVPCSADFGFTADLGPWRAIMTRKGTPQEAIDSLEAAFMDVMENDASWAEWKEANSLNDRDGQFNQQEMEDLWNEYFDVAAGLLAE